MAKGWESKSVEDQIDMAESRRSSKAPPRLAPEAVERLRLRESLEMSRTRIVHDLEAAQNPRYRALLNKTLADLEVRLARV